MHTCKCTAGKFKLSHVGLEYLRYQNLILQHGAFKGGKIFIWQLQFLFFGNSHLPGHKDPFYLNWDFSSTWKAAAQESAHHRARAGKWDEVSLPRLCYRESRSKIQHMKESPDFLKVLVLCHARTGRGRALLCSHTPLEGPVSTVLPKALRLSLTHPHDGHSLVLSPLCLHDWDHLCWTPVILHALVRMWVQKWQSPGWTHSCSVAAGMDNWRESERMHRIQVTMGGLPYHLLKYRNYSRKAPVALSAAEKPTTMLMGTDGKLLTSHLCHCFGKADQTCQLLCWELKRNREGWRKWRTCLHWHWGAVLWDQCDNPRHVFLRSLVLLRWSLLTSGQQGWMAPYFPMYQLLDTTPCVLSVWWFRTP